MKGRGYIPTVISNIFGHMFRLLVLDVVLHIINATTQVEFPLFAKVKLIAQKKTPAFPFSV